MKSGASDPFGDNEDERSESSESATGERGPVSEDEQHESADESSGEQRESEDSDDEGTDAAEPQTEDEATDADGEGFSRDELPLVLRRDRVKDERPEVHQLFVQRETHDRAVDAERTLEDRLGVDLSRTDAREAIYLAGMAHLDDAEEILRTWGYDL